MVSPNAAGTSHICFTSSGVVQARQTVEHHMKSGSSEHFMGLPGAPLPFLFGDEQIGDVITEQGRVRRRRPNP